MSLRERGGHQAVGDVGEPYPQGDLPGQIEGSRFPREVGDPGQSCFWWVWWKQVGGQSSLCELTETSVLRAVVGESSEKGPCPRPQ